MSTKQVRTDRSGRGSAGSVFVSYANEDQRWARVFVHHLRSRGWQVFIDEEILRPGEVWNQRIAEHVAGCSVVLVLISPAAAGSAWVNSELVAAVTARRPVLPVVIDSYDIGEIRRRMAIVADRQWLTLGDLGDQVDPLELDEVANHLAHLAAGSRPDPTVTRKERIGGWMIGVGILAMIAAMSWFVIAFIQAGASLADFFRALVTSEPGSESQIFDAWLAAANQIVDSFLVLPLALASIVLTTAGSSVRRNARKRRLMGPRLR